MGIEPRDGKTGLTCQVSPPNPPKITGWDYIFGPPKFFGTPNPPRLVHGLWRARAGWPARPKVAIFLF